MIILLIGVTNIIGINIIIISISTDIYVIKKIIYI
jgi:hypothetical protein